MKSRWGSKGAALGMIENFDCSTLQFQMSPSDRLLLVSDGVAEARDGQGKLFGFDRLLELVHTQTSAAQIAETAQAYGQEDDISVISVTRGARSQAGAGVIRLLEVAEFDLQFACIDPASQ